MSELWVTMTTLPDAASAQQLARTLVEEGLVACAQILPPMVSIYRWQGQIHQDPEHLILLKHPAQRYPDLERRLKQLHPYQEPEILSLSAAQVSPGYLAWAIAETQRSF